MSDKLGKGLVGQEKGLEGRISREKDWKDRKRMGRSGRAEKGQIDREKAAIGQEKNRKGSGI